MEHAAVTRVREDITTIAVPSEQAIPLVESQFMRHWHRDRFAVRSQSHHGTVAQRLLSADMDDTHADGLRYVDLVARYYVGAPTDAFREISDFSIWFFIWDDQHGRYALQRRDQQWCRLRDALHRVLDKPSLHVKNADPLVAGFVDCMQRFYKPLDERWNGDFAAHFHAVIKAYDQEYRERATRHIPSVEDYVALRCHTFATGSGWTALNWRLS